MAHGLIQPKGLTAAQFDALCVALAAPERVEWTRMPDGTILVRVGTFGVDEFTAAIARWDGIK